MDGSESVRVPGTTVNELGPRHLQRGVSFLWLLLSVGTACMSSKWTTWAAVAAYLVSLLATWLPARWAGWTWAVACIAGLALTMPERWAASLAEGDAGY